MRASSCLCAAFLPVLATAVVLLAGSAWAEEPSALERLTEGERRVLVERVPGWAGLDAAEQERIARNVLRLRALTDEDRLRLLERVGALERHREAHGRWPGDLGRGRNPAVRDEFRQRGRIVRAVGAVFWPALPEAAREAVTRTLGPQGRRALEAAFFLRWWEATAAKLAQAGVPEVPLPAEAPPGAAERIATLREKAAQGDASARLRLAHLALARRLEPLAQALARVPPGDDPGLKAVGERLRDADPEVFAATTREVVRACEEPTTLEAYTRRGAALHWHQGGDGTGGPPEARLRRLLEALRDALPLLAREPLLLGPAQRLERALSRRLEAGPGGGPGGSRRGPGPGPGGGGEGWEGPPAGAEPPPSPPPDDPPGR